jgi:23S rRNA pseudouridine1911/1915/1917 synthase
LRLQSPASLVGALESIFPGCSRRTLRDWVRQGRVLVNGAPAAELRQTLAAGDEVRIEDRKRPQRLHPQVLLLHEDRDLLVVEKGPGILSSGGSPGGPPTVESVLGRYLERGGRHGRAWPCHRLDRKVSGLLLFAKSAALAQAVRADIRRILSERVYAAVVEGVPEPAEGTLRDVLREGQDRTVRVAAPGQGGKEAVTHYRVLRSGGGYALLELRLETGRKHQIRAQLAFRGHPVAGDRRYGGRGSALGRIALHARRLAIVHPITGKPLSFDSPPPAGFEALLEGPRPKGGKRIRSGGQPDRAQKSRRQGRTAR